MPLSIKSRLLDLHTVPDVSFVFIHQQGGIHLEKCKMIAKLTKKVTELQAHTHKSYWRLMRFSFLSLDVMSDERKNIYQMFFFIYTQCLPLITILRTHFSEKISQMCSNRHLSCLFLILHLTTLTNILSLRKKQRFSSRVTCFPVVHASSHKDTFVSFELQLISLL